MSTAQPPSSNGKAKKAEKTNDHLFPILLKMLAGDSVADFATTADKLAVWLQVDKAYYSKARPTIVHLVETAHESVRRHSDSPDQPFHQSRCTDALKPWADPFLRLVRTVARFYYMFPEVDLQMRLQVLIRTFCDNVDDYLSQQPQVRQAENTQTSSTPRTVTPSSTLVTSPTVSYPQTASLSPTSPTAMAPHPPKKKRKTFVEDDFIQADLEWFQKKQSIDQLPSQPVQDPVPAESSTDVTVIEAPGASVPVIPLKRKASDAIPAEPEVAASTSQSAMLASFVARRGSVEAAEIAETRPSSSKPEPPPQGVLPSPLDMNKAKKRRKGNGPPGLRILPMDLDKMGPSSLLTAPGAASQGDSSSGSARATESKSMSKSASPSHDPQPPRVTSPPLPGTPIASLAASAPHDPSPTRAASPPARKVLQSPPAPRPAPLSLPEDSTTTPIASTVDASPKATTLTPVVPPAIEAPPTAVLTETSTIVASSEAMGINYLAPHSIPPAEIREVRSNEGVEMEKSSQSVTTHEPADESGEVSMDLGSDDAPAASKTAVGDDVVNGLVNGHHPANETAIGVSIPTVPEQPAQGSGSSETNAVADEPMATTSAPPEDTMDPTISPFESRFIRLLRLERGSPCATPAQYPVQMDFELSEDEVAQIVLWNGRHNSNTDLSMSMCVSLVTFPIAQCASALEGVSDDSLDVAKLGRPADWPRDGSVFVILDVAGDHGKPQSFYVSPPFNSCAVNHTVDLGARGLHPGTNTLHMFQYRDHSDRMFAVVLHHPTAAQLAELQKARDSERDWRIFVDGLGNFNLPMPMPRLVGVPAMYSRCAM
ncbi:hypothetical protein C8Q74DRAFT_616495 [Fomes fomentarius]|nr:hypothetical protein C8Q74DRAFT_616495 [Fomes fomentarius]